MSEHTSVWVPTETGVILWGCAPDEAKGRACIDRVAAARLAPDGYRGYLGACCKDTEMACAFDVFGDPEDIDARVTFSYALARAEGRQIDPPYRCGVHGTLTFGGCCGAESHTEGEQP